MSGRGWHLDRQEGRVLLSRRRPARFDVCASTSLPPMRLVPLVHMVRQDIWRALRQLRGFAPVVAACAKEGGVVLHAGGQVAGRPARGAVEDMLRDVLEDGRNRARWLTCAR
ncbi:MAG: hypothetical protein AAGA28_01830 [Pseudomonadota bacterium]